MPAKNSMISDILMTCHFLFAFGADDLEQTSADGHEEHVCTTQAVCWTGGAGLGWLTRLCDKVQWTKGTILWAMLSTGSCPVLQVETQHLRTGSEEVVPVGEALHCTHKGWFNVGENWHWALHCSCSFKHTHTSKTLEFYKATCTRKAILLLFQVQWAVRHSGSEPSSQV